MAERQLHGLQRVLGVNALFSTAYGNVGSSIYVPADRPSGPIIESEPASG